MYKIINSQNKDLNIVNALKHVTFTMMKLFVLTNMLHKYHKFVIFSKKICYQFAFLDNVSTTQPLSENLK